MIEDKVLGGYVLVCGDILGVLELPSIGGSGLRRRVITNGIRADSRGLTDAFGHSCTCMVCMAGVSSE
jgi:hypothetical protein